MTQVGGGTPSRQIGAYWGGPIPWASVKDFVEGGSEILTTQETITERGLRASASNLIPSATPMVCTRMAVGRSAMAPMPVAINQDVKALFPARGTTGEYLLRLLAYIQPTAEANAVGSTVKGIRVQDYLSISVPIGPASDQPRIVAILDTLDTAIRQTEAIIEKLKLVKQGLLHDLLTRGIDDNGELRPPQSAAPHLYKASALGWIPQNWEARPIREVGAFMNGLNKPKHAFGRGTKFVNISDVYADYMETSGLGRITTTVHELNRYRLELGDIVLDRSSVKLAGVGYPSEFEGDAEPVVFCGFIIRMRVTDVTATIPRYLCLQMRAARFRNEVFKVATGGANVNINQASLGDLLIVVPRPSEQSAVIERERSQDDRLYAEVTLCDKLVSQKLGLMDDLLTGRVRVTPLLTAE